MSAQHTPGPWAIKAQGEPNHYFTLSNGRWLAAIQFNGELWVLEQEANARLIAAAPELLEVLMIMDAAGLTSYVRKVRMWIGQVFDWAVRQAVHADRIGFSEYWVGEHGTLNWEGIPSPELVIAAAAWSVAFLIYLWRFAPWLMSSRLDGKDG